MLRRLFAVSTKPIVSRFSLQVHDVALACRMHFLLLRSRSRKVGNRWHVLCPPKLPVWWRSALPALPRYAHGYHGVGLARPWKSGSTTVTWALMRSNEAELKRRLRNQRQCTGMQRYTSSLRQQSLVSSRGRIIPRDPQVALLTTGSRRIDGQDELKATVTVANLFSELLRLFPRGEEAFSPLQGHRQGFQRSTDNQPSSEQVRASAPPTSMPTSRAVARGGTAAYDWRRLFLVRCASAATSDCFDAQHISHVSELQRRGENVSDVIEKDFSCTGLRQGSSLSPQLSHFDMTDQGRAVQLWQQAAFSTDLCTPKAEEEAEAPPTVFCWSSPATYELYYIQPNTSKTTPPDPSPHDASLLSSCPLRRRPREASACPSNSAEHDASLFRRDADWDVAGLTEMVRVGQLHAIPGLPQPPPLELASLPSGAPARCAEEKVMSREGRGTYAAEIENANASSCAVLVGSVCSLYDYYCQLCGTAPSTLENATRKAADYSGPAAMVSGTSTTRATGQQLHHLSNMLPHQELRGRGSLSGAQIKSAHAHLSQAAEHTSRFPFPAFFHDRVTERDVGRRNIGSRWATGYTGDAPSCDTTPSTADGGSGPVQCPPASQPSPSSYPQMWTVAQPSRPHAISAASVNARHWNCVASAEFVREYAHARAAYQETQNIAAGTETKDDRGAQLKGSFFGASVSSAYCTVDIDSQRGREQLIRECGVAVLLVHQHEWIYFSLLLHTHPSLGTGSAAMEPSGTNRFPRSATDVASGEGQGSAGLSFLGNTSPDQSRSEGLSHFYTFLHLPCRLSAEEMNQLTHANAIKDSQRTSLPLTLPRTWLVHLSTDVKLRGTVTQLWHTSELGLREGGATNTLLVSSGGDAATPVTMSDGGEGDRASLEKIAPRHTNTDADDDDCSAASTALDGDDEDAEWIPDDDLSNQHAGRCVRETQARHAREAELLRRYLWAPFPHSEQGSAAPAGSQAQWPYHVHAPMTPAAMESVKSSPITSHRFLPRFATTVSPFPNSSQLLRNHLWFAKPFVLAEEMKYGTVVKYKHEVLVVPRVRQLHSDFLKKEK